MLRGSKKILILKIGGGWNKFENLWLGVYSKVKFGKITFEIKQSNTIKNLFIIITKKVKQI